MFTGIIEKMGALAAIRTEGTNRIFDIKAHFPEPIKVDQSIAHDGVCLTVTEIYEQGAEGVHYSVTAVQETLDKTHLGSLQIGHRFNLERCMRIGDRLDGHFVQGHVDTTGQVLQVEDKGGSWIYVFQFDPKFGGLLVDKGSVCINGVSLTVVGSHPDTFSVTIIPYTYEHTNFHLLKVGDPVNLEFDILGKYLQKQIQLGSHA